MASSYYLGKQWIWLMVDVRDILVTISEYLCTFHAICIGFLHYTMFWSTYMWSSYICLILSGLEGGTVPPPVQISEVGNMKKRPRSGRKCRFWGAAEFLDWVDWGGQSPHPPAVHSPLNQWPTVYDIYYRSYFGNRPVQLRTYMLISTKRWKSECLRPGAVGWQSSCVGQFRVEKTTLKRERERERERERAFLPFFHDERDIWSFIMALHCVAHYIAPYCTVVCCALCSSWNGAPWRLISKCIQS